MPDPRVEAINPTAVRTAILRIRTPNLPKDWDRPAGVYIGTEVECMVIDAKTREPIALLDQVQKITIEIAHDDIVRAHVVTDAVEFEFELEGMIEAGAKAAERKEAEGE